MATGHQILKKNEIDANRVVEQILLALVALSVISWVLMEFGIIDLPDPFGTILYLGGAIINAGVVMLCHKTNGRNKALKYVMVLLMLLDMTTLAVVFSFEGWLFMILPVIASIRYYEKEFTLITGIATSIMLLVGMLVSANPRNTIFYYVLFQVTFAIVIAISVSIASNGREIIERQQRAADEKFDFLKRTERNRMQIMTSQIQPHFINNSLNTICYLIEEDPKKAIRAVTDFASYLQVNLNTLREDEDIAFEYELDHIMSYLNLEQLRFGDKLKVIYEINDTDFEIPPLTVQPIVENAVKHGICSRKEGGTVRISTKELPHFHEITVTDDGVGFDVDILESQGTENLGINNVKARLFDRCGGKLNVQSGPTTGTMVTILIPKGSTLDEGHTD